MNINLVSPSDNGNEYTVRFKEDILIPKNSKVYLNFASLSRENNLELKADEFLGIVVSQDDQLPRVGINTGSIGKAYEGFPTSNNSIKITKGRYSAEGLVNTISAGLQTIIAGINTTNKFNYSHLRSYDTIDSYLDKYLVGLVKNYRTESLNKQKFEIDITRSRGVAITHSGEGVKTTNANIAPEASGASRPNSYSLSTKEYNHIGFRTADDINKQNWIWGQCVSTPAELQAAGGITWLGLSSKYRNEGFTDADTGYPKDTPFRTRGNTAAINNGNGGTGNNTGLNANPLSFYQRKTTEATAEGRYVPDCFVCVGVGVNSKNGIPYIYVATASGATLNAGNSTAKLSGLDRQYSKFDTMVMRRSASIASVLGTVQATNANVILGIQTYYKEHNKPYNEQNLYFRIFAGTSKPINNNQIDDGIIYDSGKGNNNFFNPKFFYNTDNLANAPYEELSAQGLSNSSSTRYPFTPFYAGMRQDIDGFEFLDFDARQQDVAPDNQNFDIYRYRLSATGDLARILGFSEAGTARTDGTPQFLSRFLYPALLQSKSDFSDYALTNTEKDITNKSYSVYINNIPIRNFKNTTKKQNGGFAKSILGNIPVPFSEYTSGDNPNDGGRELITATYKPNFQVFNNLYNNEIKTNNFNVSIRNLDDDKPSTEILNSLINFTIQPPDDYNANL